MPKLYMLTEYSPFMMGFVFITDCDHAVIVDGGRPMDMQQLHHLIGDRTIRAWILTHPHEDHISGFVNEIQKADIYDRVEKIYYHFPSEAFTIAQPSEALPHVISDFYRAYPTFAEKSVEVVPPFRIQVDELCVDFLFCGGERFLYPRPNLAVNESSLVFRVTSEGMRSVLFLGDLGPEGGRDLLQMWGDTLKSDIVQMAHHGHAGVEKDVYEQIAPEACLWCCPEWLWEEEDIEHEPGLWGTKHQRKWMEELGVKEHYVSMNGLQEIRLRKEG